MATKTTFTEREQKWIEHSQREFNTYMKKWLEDNRIITFWTDFTKCEMKHFSKIILDVDDLYEEEIEKCESPKNIKKATNDIKKLYQKLVEENKSDLSKLTDLVIVFQRKAQQHEGLDNGIYALVRVYNSLIDETADYVAEHIEEYDDKGIKQFESISEIGVR